MIARPGSESEQGGPGSRRGPAVLGVVGDLTEDIVVWPQQELRYGTDTPARVFRRRGGSAANVAAFAARQRPTRFIGCVGADSTGDALVDEMTRLGVEMRVQRRATTATVVVLVDDSGERTMLPDRAAATMLDDVDPSWVAGLAHLHAPSYGFETEPARSAIIDLLGQVRGQGGTISTDVSSTGLVESIGVASYHDLLARLEPDVVFANASEAALLEAGGGGRLPEATTVVVKNGSRPTVVKQGAEVVATVDVPAVDDLRDSTGAGDAFAAGYLHAHLAGRAPAGCCETGHALAATVLSSPGASTPDVTDAPAPERN